MTRPKDQRTPISVQIVKRHLTLTGNFLCCILVHTGKINPAQCLEAQDDEQT